MKTMRKLLCLLLALVFAAALLPAAALAEDGHTHDWQERSRTEPSCTKEGSVTYTCACGETFSAAASCCWVMFRSCLRVAMVLPTARLSIMLSASIR